MRSITIAAKDLKILSRDTAALFWVLGFPLVIGVLFGSIFGGDGGGRAPTKIAYVDEDRSNESENLLARLGTSKAVKVQEMPESQASEAVRKGDLAAFVVIPKGYGEAERQFRTADKSIRLGTDPARSAEVGMLQGVIAEAVYKGIGERFSDPKKMSETASQSMKDIDKADLPATQKASLRRFMKELNAFGLSSAGQAGQGNGYGFQGPKIETENITGDQKMPASAFEVSFPQALLWGMLGVVSSFAIGLVRERQQGTMVRLRVSPLSFREILVGKGLACFVTCIAVMLALLLVGAALFHVRIGSPAILALAVSASAFCLVGMMMMLSVMGKTEQSVAGSVWGVLIIMAMFGGGMIPVFIMPSWMQAASSLSPLKWVTLSIEGAIWRGFTISEMLVPVLVLLGVGAVCFAVGVRVLARREA